MKKRDACHKILIYGVKKYNLLRNNCFDTTDFQRKCLQNLQDPGEYARRTQKMKQKSDTGVTFSEVQKFRQRSLWILLVIMDLLALIFFGYGMFKQLIIGQAWGSRPLPDLALAIVGSFFLLLLAVITYIFYTLKLVTEVRNDGLSIRFFPLTHRLIPYAYIKTCEARSYLPYEGEPST